MSPFKSWRALSRSWAGRPIRCPHCGQQGFDYHGLPPEREDDAVFEVRGHMGAKPVRKCLKCGGGLFIKGGGRTEAIAPEQWSRMDEYWVEESARIDERIAALNDEQEKPAELAEETDTGLEDRLRAAQLDPMWWSVVREAIARCSRGEGHRSVMTSAGPCAARGVVALLGVEDFVDGKIDWETPMEGASAGDSRWFPPPNDDFEPPRAASPEELRPLRDWLMPSSDEAANDPDVRWIDGRVAQDVVDESEGFAR